MQIDFTQAAAALVRDHAEKRNITPFAHSMGARNLADAYRIQSAFAEQLRALQGEAAGYKIGLTSVRMQQMCSVNHPVAGVVFQKRVLASGVHIRLDSLVRLGIEFEICVRLGKTLPPRTAPYQLADVAAAVDAVAPAFEVIDDRNSAYPLDLLSLVADNAWNEGIVLGEFKSTWPELAAVRGVVELDGVVIDQGHGRDVLGHPFEPLRWLANHLSSRGETLNAGAIISTGSLVTTRFPKSGEHYGFTVEGIGTTEIFLD
jgi:2-keto-4-pentenoate hydratase